MHKHLQKMNEHTFEKIFNQQLGFLMFKDFCNTCCEEPVPQLKFYEEVSLICLIQCLFYKRQEIIF
jgi:beta-adrenergic-receptor kinase